MEHGACGAVFLIVDPETWAMWRLDENPIGVEYLDTNIGLTNESTTCQGMNFPLA